MAIYGLTPNGFNRKRLDDIKTELEDSLKVLFGENIDLSPQSVFGQIVGVFSEQIADEWEQQELVYNSQYPNTASGAALDNVVLLNGITRNGATFSTVVAALTGVENTFIPQGSQASVVGTGEKFQSIGDIIIPASGAIDVTMIAINEGVVEAVASTLTTIETPVFGWTSVNNANDAAVGQDVESDAELRARRTLSTSANGQNTLDALFAQLSDLNNVESVRVVDNKTDAVDANGIPAHQFEAVVLGGDDDAIANIVWINTTEGIASHGDVTVIITDNQGFPQEPKFTRPSDTNIFFKATISTNNSYPATGTEDVKAAIVTFGQVNFGIGDDVILSQFYTAINSVPGIVSIDLRIGLSASPTGTANLVIPIDEISRYLVTNVQVIES